MEPTDQIEPEKRKAYFFIPYFRQTIRKVLFLRRPKPIRFEFRTSAENIKRLLSDYGIRRRYLYAGTKLQRSIRTEASLIILYISLQPGKNTKFLYYCLAKHLERRIRTKLRQIEFYLQSGNEAEYYPSLSNYIIPGRQKTRLRRMIVRPDKILDEAGPAIADFHRKHVLRIRIDSNVEDMKKILPPPFHPVEKSDRSCMFAFVYPSENASFRYRNDVIPGKSFFTKFLTAVRKFFRRWTDGPLPFRAEILASVYLYDKGKKIEGELLISEITGKSIWKKPNAIEFFLTEKDGPLFYMYYCYDQISAHPAVTERGMSFFENSENFQISAASRIRNYAATEKVLKHRKVYLNDQNSFAPDLGQYLSLKLGISLKLAERAVFYDYISDSHHREKLDEFHPFRKEGREWAFAEK